MRFSNRGNRTVTTRTKKRACARAVLLRSPWSRGDRFPSRLLPVDRIGDFRAPDGSPTAPPRRAELINSNKSLYASPRSRKRDPEREKKANSFSTLSLTKTNGIAPAWFLSLSPMHSSRTLPSRLPPSAAELPTFQPYSFLH